MNYINGLFGSRKRNEDPNMKMKQTIKLLLASDKLSKNEKVGVHIINDVRVIGENLASRIEKYAQIENCENCDIDTLKEIHEYLTLVNAGITRFFDELSKKEIKNEN